MLLEWLGKYKNYDDKLRAFFVLFLMLDTFTVIEFRRIFCKPGNAA